VTDAGTPTAAALPDPRSGPQKDARLVQSMFDRVAPRYDLANTIFSAGYDRHWRRVAVAAVDPRPGEVVVDVAAGTGALAHELAAVGRRRSGWPQTQVVALDFSWNMLHTGALRQAARGGEALPDDVRAPREVLWCNGDGTRLPFADASVDVVTIAFGLRNLPDPAAGLREFARVLRPGGRVAVLEFSRPVHRPMRAAYLRGVLAAMPGVARLVTSDPRAYRYLADSIRAWPDQESLALRIAASGFTRVRWKNLTGGIVALHHALRS
jgi:demethylmenaquinone methyltransferase / 2-methoxy-6-polyprenyl-1,4-benzoquinol methylase